MADLYFDCCAAHGLALSSPRPFHVAAWIEDFPGSKPTVKQKLAAVRIDLLDRDDFDIGSDVVCAAKVEHFLGFGDAPDVRAGETAAAHDEAEGGDPKGLRGSARASVL
jgi:hypothetical protein